MAMRYGAHLGDVEGRVGVSGLERTDERDVIFGKIVAEEGPIARVGIVYSEVYHHDIGLESQGVLIRFLLNVGAMTARKEGCARVSEVAHIVTFTQLLL